MTVNIIIQQHIRDTDDVIFIGEDENNVYVPRRWQKSGATRMPGHLYKSILTTHDNYDCWLLFLDDRAANGRDTPTRIGALQQFQKHINYKKGIHVL